jgi:hypothetical protein
VTLVTRWPIGNLSLTSSRRRATLVSFVGLLVLTDDAAGVADGASRRR